MRVLPLHVVPHADPPAIFPWQLPDGPLINALTPVDLGNQRHIRAADTARLRRTIHQLELRFGQPSAVTAIGDITSIGHGISGGGLVHSSLKPPLPREPAPHESALELPSRLQLSPHSDGAFTHSVREVEHGGRVELWHSRLGNRSPASDAIVDIDSDAASPVDETPSPSRTVRAVWTRDFVSDDEVAQGSAAFPNEDFAAPATLAPFRSSLSARDRMQLVHLTSNHRYPGVHRFWRPTAVPVENLMLTALGGWLASEVHFPDELPEGLSIEEWRHRTTMGRDHYVKVVYQGALLPFGHRASLIKVTERRVKGDGHATLYQRLFVVVRQPERHFLSSGVAAFDNAMPFRLVRILTASTPPLAKPTKLEASASGQIFVPSVATTDSPPTGAAPQGTEPFRFRMLALDVDSHLVEFEGPLVFVEKTVFETARATRELARFAANAALPPYPMRGQRIAYAPPGDADDTTLATTYIRFEALFDKTTVDAPRNFVLPVMKEASAPVPAMVAFTGQTDPQVLHYADAYRAHAFGGAGMNDVELFLELGGAGGSAAMMGFSSQADKSGAFVSPSVDVKALARRVGPVGGDLTALASNAGSFDVGSMFGVAAKLFGILPLSDLLPSTGGPLPTFVTQMVNTALALQQGIGDVRDIINTNAAALQSQSAQAWQDAQAFVVEVAAFDDAVALLAQHPADDPGLTDILARVVDAAFRLSGTVAGAGLPRPVLEHTTTLLDRLTSITAPGDAAEQILSFYRGLALPEVVNAQLEWSTPLEPWPQSGAPPVFDPQGDRTLRLTSEVQAPLTASGTPGTLVSCSLPPFHLSLMGDLQFIVIRVDVMEFSIRPGRKPDVNVALAEDRGIEFLGPLAFVEALKTIIPFDGFSDPPYLDISTSGVKAGFDLAVPDLAVGIFALTNIHLGAELSVPFIGESLEFRFYFATREDPFRLQVAFFAGGGFFALTLSPEGLRVIEAAFEFGAAVEMSFVVARGSISVMAGIYFRLELVGDDQSVQLTGYFRARGEVDVLGLISACIELYLELSYRAVTVGGHISSKAVGKASISVEVSVCFASFSVTVTCEKQFAGSSGDPTFIDMMGSYVDSVGTTYNPWAAYCDAFATEPVA